MSRTDRKNPGQSTTIVNRFFRKIACAALGLAALAATTGTARADYPSEVLADGPLAYYRLNESVTTPTFDTIVNSGTLGAAVNGIYSGSVTHPVSGILPANGAASANGTILSVAYNAGLNPAGAFTIEAWLKPSVANGAGVLTCALASMHAASPRTGWLIYQSDTGWNFRMYNGVDTATTISITGGGAPVAGNWYHLVVSFDGTTARMYVNGVAGPSAAPAAFVQNSDSAFNIASRSDGAFGWNGTADEVAFYPSALSASDAAAHNAAVTTNAAGYASQILASSPAGYWRLNESVPVYQVATNSGSLGVSANAKYFNGVTNAAGPSSPAFPGFGASNPCGKFDGSSGSVGSPLGLLNNRAKFTVMGWVKRGAVHSTRGGYFGQNDLLEFGDAGGGVNIEAWVDATGGNLVVPYPWADDEWGFITLTADGTTATLYLNGAVATTRTAPVASYGTNAFKFNIGGGGIFNASGDFFLGDIDEVAVFDKTLTAGRVLSLYLTATGGVVAPFMVSDPPVQSPAGTVYTTTPFTLTADVAGALPMSFQWRTNGTPIPGATSANYTKASATLSDAGNYDLVAINAYGAVTSSVVVVTVDPAVPPTIDVPPSSRLVYAGGNAQFTVAASGTSPLTYQWKHAGTNLPGATSVTLLVTNCTAAEAGAYTVGVSNVAGGLISSPAASLSLITPAPGSYEERAVSFKPLAYWRLNESSGTTAFDYMGGYDGTASGAVTPASPSASSPQYPGLGAGNTGYNFDGASGTVQIGNPAGLNVVGRFSVAVWVKLASTSGGLHNIFMHGYSTGPNGEAGLRRNGGVYQFFSWDGADHLVAAPIPAEDVGNWVYLVGTYNGTNYTLYHNGAQVGSVANAVGAVPVNLGWAIGSRGGNLSDGRFFDGDIDEVALFNKALTSQEVCALYNRAIGFTGSVEPTIKAITGTGINTVTNENFNVTDGGFTFVTPAPSTETDWSYTGTTWWSPGQATGFGNDNVSFLISPAYTVTKAGVVKLSFNHRHSFEADATLWDGGAVDVSINGGSFVRVSALAFDQNGYNGVGGGAPTLLGQSAFTGNSAGHPAFITSSCVLAGVQVGDTVRVRFVADYDNNTTGNLTPSGWEIDSIQLTEGGSGAVSVACPCGTLQQTGTLGAPWVDAGNPVIMETKSGPQRFFRVKP